MPEFPGGHQEMMKFINTNLRYPSGARENGIEGRVVVQFVVSDKGEILDIKVLRDIGGGCAQEVVRVVKMMPAWKPAKQNNSAVSAYFKMPVSFVLGDEAMANHGAEFKGGNEKFQLYLLQHLKYPRKAKKNEIIGVLRIDVRIDPLGHIRDYTFKNNIGYGCEKAAEKILKSIKSWEPARKNKLAVDGTCSLKFTFPPK